MFLSTGLLDLCQFFLTSGKKKYESDLVLCDFSFFFARGALYLKMNRLHLSLRGQD